MTEWNYTYDITTPDGGDSPTIIDDRIQEAKAATQERLDVDHFFELTGEEVSDEAIGEHRKITFYGAAATPEAVAGKGFVYIKVVDEKVELHWFADGKEIALTDKGALNLGAAGPLLNDTFLTAIGEVGPGTVNLIKAGRNEADDADVAVLPDAVRTVSNAPPAENTGVANKKYVDDKDAVLGGKILNFSGATVFNTTMTTANTWQDLDLSAKVGAKRALVFLEIYQSGGSGTSVKTKPKDYGSTFADHPFIGASALNFSGSGQYGYVIVATDAAGVIQIAATSRTVAVTIKLIAFTANA